MNKKTIKEQQADLRAKRWGLKIIDYQLYEQERENYFFITLITTTILITCGIVIGILITLIHQGKI